VTLTRTITDPLGRTSTDDTGVGTDPLRKRHARVEAARGGGRGRLARRLPLAAEHMAVLAPIFAFVGRQLGRLVQMVFGWAAILLFGRVPQSKQMLLTLVTFGSVIWVVTLIGVLVPDVGTFLIALVPVPAFVEETWVRLAMLALAIMLPLGIGTAGLFLMDESDRPASWTGRIGQVLRGYPYAAVLALVLLFLIVVAPAYKVRTLVKRWDDAHIPIVIPPGAYERVAGELEAALDAAGLDLHRRRAPVILETPSRLLATVGGASVRRLVPDRLLMLSAAHLEVTMHPSDIAMAGAKDAVARARAAVADRLTETEAYLTTTQEAQEVEDEIRALRTSTAATAGGVLRRLDGHLARLVIPYEEWEVLYRQRLQVERDLLRNEQHASPPVDAEAKSRDDGPIARIGRAVDELLGKPESTLTRSR
jgi:hypothetical protein